MKTKVSANIAAIYAVTYRVFTVKRRIRKLSLPQVGPRIRFKLPISEITLVQIPLILPFYAELGKVGPKSWVKIGYMTVTILYGPYIFGQLQNQINSHISEHMN